MDYKSKAVASNTAISAHINRFLIINEYSDKFKRFKIKGKEF